MKGSRLILPAVFLLLTAACTMHRKVAALVQDSVGATIAIGEDSYIPELDTHSEKSDTIKVEDFMGREMILMKAVRDENGQMVATDVIQAAVVTAKFRNVAERHGKVDIKFRIAVPAQMQDSRWQLRFRPLMHIMGDTVALDPVIITGRDYRRAQLRGYQQYERFLSTIITDTTRFINLYQLENFLKRNIPEVYRFKADSSYVSDEEFASAYGVTQKQAVEHYTNRLMVRRNEGRIARKGKMYGRYVKAPIVTEGIRLDTVIRTDGGDFLYDYTQTVHTRPQLRKVCIVLCGEIFEQDRKVYDIPQCEPLTFYISSISSFTDGTERYLSRVIERKVEANTACYIDFRAGKADIDMELGENRTETERIRSNLASLMDNREFDLDSIVVTATCSPEGRYAFNATLSQKRSESVSRYFGRFMKEYLDSVKNAEGFAVDEDGSLLPDNPSCQPIRFISRSEPENWRMLDYLVHADSVLNATDKEVYDAIRNTSDPDMREKKLSREKFYLHLREELYPKLRTVRFDFHLHRKGMVKDTIHTTVPDSTYMRGVQALRDRDYKAAVTLLRPYGDFNAAVACCAMDYNATALEILSHLSKDDRTEYITAIILSRMGDDAGAVQHYINACGLNPGMIHRGNLDPEISVLIKRYGINLNQSPEE